MHVTGKQIAIGLGVVAGAVGIAALLSGCAPKEQDADSFALDKFGGFDREPKDNKWTAGETTNTSSYLRTQEVDTYRVGDYIFGTREIRKTTTTDSMNRIYDAAKGNDAVLSLQELREFALREFDKDNSGTLNKDERKHFSELYDPTSRSRTEIVGRESFSRYSPRNDYPDPNYPGNPYPGGGTGGGDTPGYPTNPYPGGGSGGGTGGGDTGGGVPSYPGGGSGGGTGGGDTGGGVPSNPGGGSGGGNSTGNGNPGDGDF